MNRDQVKELFKLIVSVYPNFEVSTSKINTWTRMMKKMDFKRVMAKVESHIQENKFPPTISEISAFPPEKNEHLEKMKKWKKEASQVPNEVKQEFRNKLLKLVREKKK